MSATPASWTSSNGIVLADLVPAAARREWVDLGYCPNRDLYTLFGAHARAHPEREAVVDGAGTLSYAALEAAALCIAAALADAGLGPHDIIGIQVPNGRRCVAAELGVAALGAVALPYPTGRGSREALGLLRRSRASAAIVADAAGDLAPAANLAAHRPELPALREIFVFGDAPAGCRPLDPWLTDASAGRRWHPRAVDPEAPARILVSSGSEGEPKMVAYSHNAMAGGRGNYIGALHEGPEPMRNLVLVPLASSFGSCGTSVTIARHGGTLLLQQAFDPSGALRMIATHRPTHVYGVPTMLGRIAAQSRTPHEDTSSLRAVVVSGDALQQCTAKACRARLGCPVLNVYGSSDGVNCHTLPGDAEGTHVGRPDPRVAEIRIAAPDGTPEPEGRAGEIWARGPMSPLCYVNDPALDARCRTEHGWVRTADRGRIDPGGCLYVLGRMRPVVIRGGYNISPTEVERQLHAHPALAEAACVPVPDPDLGERLCACVSQLPGTARATLDDLNAFLEGERGLERRKLPELLVTLPQLPLGPAGKVCRRTLARLAAAQIPGGKRR